MPIFLRLPQVTDIKSMDWALDDGAFAALIDKTAEHRAVTAMLRTFGLSVVDLRLGFLFRHSRILHAILGRYA